MFAAMFTRNRHLDQCATFHPVCLTFILAHTPNLKKSKEIYDITLLSASLSVSMSSFKASLRSFRIKGLLATIYCQKALQYSFLKQIVQV